jgi:hypothetical protein
MIPCAEPRGRSAYRSLLVSSCHRKGRKYSRVPNANMVKVITTRTKNFRFGCRAVDVCGSFGSAFGLRADWTSMVRLTRRQKSDNASLPDFIISACLPNTEGAKPWTSPVTRLTITRTKTNRSRKHVKFTSDLASIATTIMRKGSVTRSGRSGALCNPFQPRKISSEKKATRNSALFAFLTGQYSA